MNNLTKQFRTKAAEMNRHIVLPEGCEPRTILAAKYISDQRIARITLIGDPIEIQKAQPSILLEGVNIINPQQDDISKYVDLLYNLRKDKGMTREEAVVLCQNNLYLGSLIVQNGDADGMVAGAITNTGDVLRPALQIIKTAKGIKTVSSCFIMLLPEFSPYKTNNILIMGDCSVNIEPDAEQLASIAIASAQSAINIAGISPKIAMLSFSTKGSAKHEFVDKVVEATKIIKEKSPNLNVDGELQADTALIESVANLKAPDSNIAGNANVLIFPDLQSGNIGYKLVQRLAGAQAIGPICQGFNKPVNDLSRGCSVDDIIDVVAITCIQSNQ
ncbi:MAG: phosphate acetyltransferase [Firmicutes bacterium]|nr:phosphate acetyltransferase [Bacillota bacterium]MCL1954150.1 phosphate acetyltransferase [Bacillota bacterium]